MSASGSAPGRAGRPGRGAKTGPQPYDFRRPATLPREQVRAVQLACETFARRYSTMFTSSLRVDSHVTLVSIEQVTYEEYTAGLTSPTLITLISLEPLPGTAILEFSLATAMVSVDHLLGGPGGPQPQRPLSELEVPLLRGLRQTGGIDLAAKRRLDERGLEACVREAAAAITDRAQRELSFQSCARVSGADGAFGPEEATVLRILREAWQFSDEDVQRLLVLATRP